MCVHNYIYVCVCVCVLKCVVGDKEMKSNVVYVGL